MRSEIKAVNVLIVDNDSEYVVRVRGFLESNELTKFKVNSFDNGKEALSFLEKNDTGIDLILTDYFLPDMTGVEFTKEVREWSSDTPLIFLTSNKELKIAVEAMKVGANDYFIKENTEHDLLQRALLNTLKRAKLKSQLAQVNKSKIITEKKTEALKALIVTICHELNNPLAAIRISLDVLRKHELTPDESKLLSDLEKTISGIEKKINEVRDFDFEKHKLPEE